MGRYRWNGDEDEDGGDGDGDTLGFESIQPNYFNKVIEYEDPNTQHAVYGGNDHEQHHDGKGAAMDSRYRREATHYQQYPVHQLNHQVQSSQPTPSAYLVTQQNGVPCLVPLPNGTVCNGQSRRKTNWWFWIVVVAVVYQLVIQYGPPAPPPEYTKESETWNQFFERHALVLLEALMALFSTIPHVGHWISIGIRHDVQQLLNSRSCPLQIPAKLNLDDDIVGQPRALSVVSEALMAWEPDEAALVLAFSGTVGVGKLALATQLAKSILPIHCIDGGSVLKVKGREFSSRLDLVPHLLQHTMRRSGSGTVIIIQHPEEMAPGLLSKAVESLRSIPNLLVVITTHSGSRLVHKSLKEEQSLLELDLTLHHEIETNLGLDSHAVHAVAPFVPLLHDHLAQILQRLVANIELQWWKSIHMTPALAEAWTDAHHVEYLEWKWQGKSILKFASEGAKRVDGKIRPNLLAKLRSCFASSIQPDKAAELDLVSDDGDGDQAVFRWCGEDGEGSSVCEQACRFHLHTVL